MKKNAKKKVKIHTATFGDELYNANYEVHIGPITETIGYCENRYNSDILNAERCAGCYFYIEERDLHVIVLNPNANSEVIFHECLHATFAALKKIGIEHSKETEESFCYYQGWLAKKIQLAMRDIRANKNIKKSIALPKLKR